MISPPMLFWENRLVKLLWPNKPTIETNTCTYLSICENFPSYYPIYLDAWGESFKHGILVTVKGPMWFCTWRVPHPRNVSWARARELTLLCITIICRLLHLATRKRRLVESSGHVFPQKMEGHKWIEILPLARECPFSSKCSYVYIPCIVDISQG